MKGKKRKEQRASPDFAVERAGSKVLQKEEKMQNIFLIQIT